MTRRAEVVGLLERHFPQLRERYGLRRLRLYGSLARGEETDDSDVDVLVEFGQVPSLFDLGRLQEELEGLLGRRVDLATPGGLHPRILRTAEQEGVEVGA